MSLDSSPLGAKSAKGWFSNNQRGPTSEPTSYKQFGSTQHFEVFYDDANLSGLGILLGQEVIDNCEKDFAQVQDWFGGMTLPTSALPFKIMLDAGPPWGAYHWGCGNSTIHILNVDDKHSGLTSLLVVAEVVEVLAYNQNIDAWKCSWSNGEALSRVLATASKPPKTLIKSLTSASVWLDAMTKADGSKGRDDFVNTTIKNNGDTNDKANGCGTLFLNYLHYQLGFSWRDIVAAGNTTDAKLADTYQKLANGPNGFRRFAKTMQQAFPLGQPSDLDSDNPFPLPIPAEPPGPTQQDRLLNGEALVPNQSIAAADLLSTYHFTLQDDGNLVFFATSNLNPSASGTVLWSSKSAGHADVWEMVMQNDGNLVVYDVYGSVLWNSNTIGQRAWLMIWPGNAAIYDIFGFELWSTSPPAPKLPILALTLSPPAGTDDSSPKRKITVTAHDPKTGQAVVGTVTINGRSASTGTEIDYPGCSAAGPGGKQFVPCQGIVSALGYTAARFTD
jgi:hypothetical protein